MSPLLTLPGPTSGLKIGLFGGSFNPAHTGHLLVAETAMKRLGLDWVWWIVARGNPLKSEHGDFEARLASAQRMADHPRMRVSDLEKHAGLTYTCDTLAALMQRAPQANFVWLMGADSLAEFHRWKKWQQIAAAVPIAVIARPGSGRKARFSPFAQRYQSARVPEYAALSLAGREGPAWLYLDGPVDPSSSTAIRRAKKGKA